MTAPPRHHLALPDRFVPPMDRYVVIGNPVSHSLSPAIHAHFAKEAGESLEYGTLLVPAGQFMAHAQRFFDAGGMGANVTLPFKVNAFHWAVNRGKLEVVRLLLRHQTPLETRNMHGGTVLGTAVWSIINEPWWPDHLQIIEELIEAGARWEEVGYPTGHEKVDAVLRRQGAK